MRTLRYLRWQALDHAITRGAVMLVIGVVFILPILLVPDTAATNLPPPSQVLSQSLRGMALFLVLVATYGIIGEDVRRGYFRNLFSKPISPPAYYVQAFVIGGIVYAAVMLILIGVFALVRSPTWPEPTLIRLGFWYVLGGSLVFGLSRVTRFDWLFAIFLWVAGTVARGRYPPSESLRGAVLNVLLPPSHLVGSGIIRADGTFSWPQVAWVAGYAAAFLLLGVILLRAMAFGSQRS